MMRLPSLGVGRVVRRLVSMVPVLAGVSVVVFVLVHLVPGDPAQSLLGPQARPEAVANLRTQLGLDEPLPDQYASYVGDLVTGDLGTSLTYDRPVAELVAERWAPTVWLVAYAAVLVVAITLPLALGSARRPGGRIDGVVRAVSLVGLGMPSFWVGLLLILVLGINFHVFPVSGYGVGFVGHLQSMTLPALTVALSMAPITVRALRSSLVEVFESEHLVAIRAKGLSERRVVMGYALRTAVIPVVTVLGVNLGWLIGNTVVIEEIFVLPGLGSLMISAITTRDLPVVQSLALVFAALVVVISLLTDIARSWLDPRIEMA